MIESLTNQYFEEMISQMPPFEAFGARLRSKQFTEAANLLAQYCTGLTEATIAEILTLAYVRGTELDFSKLNGALYQRRRRINNGIENMKKPLAVETSKAERRKKHAGSHRPY